MSFILSCTDDKTDNKPQKLTPYFFLIDLHMPRPIAFMNEHNYVTEIATNKQDDHRKLYRKFITKCVVHWTSPKYFPAFCDVVNSH